MYDFIAVCLNLFGHPHKTISFYLKEWHQPGLLLLPANAKKFKLTHSPNSFPSHFSETNKQKMLLPPSCVVFSNSSKSNTHSLFLFIFAFFPFFPNLSFFRLLNVILTFFIYARLLFFPFIYKNVIAGDSKYRGFLSVGAGSRLNCDWEWERGKGREENGGGDFTRLWGTWTP